MNDRYILLASAFLAIFFFLGGMLGVLDHFLSKMILFTGFLVFVIYIIFTKAKDDKNVQ